MILLLIGQLFAPVIAVWPVYAIFLTGIIVSLLVKKRNIAKKFLFAGVVVVGFLLVLRGAILLIVPYTTYHIDIPLTATGNYQLLADFSNGEISVSYEKSDHFAYEAYDLKGIKPFKIEETSRLADGKETRQQMVHLAGLEGYSVITMSHARASLQIPYTYTQDQYFQFISTTCSFNLGNNTSEKLFINTQYSTCHITIPVSIKSTTIDLFSHYSPTVLEFDPHLTIIIDDTKNSLQDVTPAGFRSETRGHYIHQGTTEDSTVKIILRGDPRTLVIKELSAQ